MFRVTETRHVYPVDDLIEHDTESDTCVCIPEVTQVGHGWLVVHHSLDGRERFEHTHDAVHGNSRCSGCYPP